MKKKIRVVLSILLAPAIAIAGPVAVYSAVSAAGKSLKALTAPSMTLNTTGNGPALSVSGVPSGQSAIEVPQGTRIWLDGATHGLAITYNSGRLFVLGTGTNTQGDLIVGSNITLAGSISGATTITASSSSTKGSITMTGGTGTATVTSGCLPVCSDASATPAAVRCTVSTTTLTATGTSGHVANYICL